jgi:hypothetical protein
MTDVFAVEDDAIQTEGIRLTRGLIVNFASVAQALSKIVQSTG